MDSLLLRSVELMDDCLKDRIIFRVKGAKFHRSQTHCIFSVSNDSLIDVDLENNLVSFFRASDHTYRPIELPDDEFSAVEAVESSDQGTYLMVFTQLRFGPQKTEKGSQKVFIVDSSTETLKRLPTINGPVYTTKWSHSGQSFAILAGIAPSYVIIYNCSGEPTTLLGRLYANLVEWSPDDTHLAVGGFGLLDNEVTVYHHLLNSNWEVSCRVSVRGATSFGFFKDSHRFWLLLCNHEATEKNRFQIFNLKGDSLFRQDFDPNPLYNFQEFISSDLTRQPTDTSS